MQLLANLIVFQCGWFACVLAAAHDYPWLGTAAAMLIVGWHLYRLPRPATGLALILLCGLLGLVLDSLPVALGLLHYHSGMLISDLAPNWIIAMWLLFATLPNISLRWLRGHMALAAGLGAVGGPLAYYAGIRLGAASFTEPAWQALLLLAANWAIAMPLIMALASRFDGTAETTRQNCVRTGSGTAGTPE